MKANLRKYIVFILIAIALFALGAVFYSLLKSRAASTIQPASSTASGLPNTVDHHPNQTPVPYLVAPPGLAYPPSMSTPIPYPYPLRAQAATGTAQIAFNETYVASLARTMTAEPTMNVASQTALVEQRAAYLQETIQDMKRLGAIMLDDNGRTYTYTLTPRFFVFLDDERYPVAAMDCVPQWVIGSVSSGSLRGRDLYPIYYDASIVGSCTLKNHNFAVKIVVVDIPTPAPTPP